MNSKKLIGMAVAFVIFAGIALIQKQGTKKRRPDMKAAGVQLFDGLDLNTIDAIDVEKDANSVSLVKKDGKWINASLYNYPVDFSKLADALRSASDVKLGAPVRTSNVDAKEFGFDQSKTLILKSSGKEVARVDVGAQREGSDAAGWANQHFIRENGKDDIYLVDYDFSPFDQDAEDWIDDGIVNVRSADMVSVKAGDVDLKVDGSDWKLSDLDEEKEEFQPSEANKLRMALQYLSCRTIADPELDNDATGFTNSVEYVAKDKDGLIYTVTVGGEVDDGRYARFVVSYEKPNEPSAPTDDAEQEEKDAYKKELEAFNKTCEANRKRANELNSKRSKWTYVISASDADDFMIGREKLVKEKEPTPAEEVVNEENKTSE